MFQGVKFRVERDGFQVCSLRFDLFHEGFLLGLSLLNLGLSLSKLGLSLSKVDLSLSKVGAISLLLSTCYRRLSNAINVLSKFIVGGAPPLILR